MSLAKKIAQYKKKFPTVKNLVITPSKRPEKRFKAEFDIGQKHKTIHFGLKGAYTYFDGAPNKKRRLYQARASKITNKSGVYTYRKAGTANSLAYWILW
jgi:ribosome-associated translation inhibitor RaiA